MLHVYSAIEYTATQHDIAANNIYTCTDVPVCVSNDTSVITQPHPLSHTNYNLLMTVL